MFLSSSGSDSLSAVTMRFVQDLTRSVEEENSKRLVELLKDCSLSQSDLLRINPEVLAAFDLPQFAVEYLMYLRARVVAHNDSGALEALTMCVRAIASNYAATEAMQATDWLFPVFSFLLTSSRKFANSMDRSADTRKWRTKMVEVFREIFPTLFRAREKLNGTCWLVCELLYLYMSLDQVKLCSHILAALSQSLVKEGGFNPENVRKSVAVTLFFYWGKFDIMESRFADAHRKLAWAFANCPHSHPNRKRIAEYFTPAMIVIGIFPRDALILECDLEHFRGLAQAVKTGDIQSYNQLIQDNMLTLAKSGTLILMEKCKLICYRNLSKRVARIVAEVTGDQSKLDLRGFEAAWKYIEGASKDETVCTLADLIFCGLMKGYIALEHKKLVLSKANPFPRIDEVML